MPKMPTRKKNVTKGDLFKVFGILYAMTTVEIASRRSYWSTDSAGHQHQLLENALAWAIIVLRIFWLTWRSIKSPSLTTVRTNGGKFGDLWRPATKHGLMQANLASSWPSTRVCLHGMERETPKEECRRSSRSGGANRRTLDLKPKWSQMLSLWYHGRPWAVSFGTFFATYPSLLQAPCL